MGSDCSELSMLIINYRGVKLMGLLGLGLDYMADDDETYNDHGF
ncbi:hypothetical protein SPBRAN_184 [uncultured Candidatus Thioglobus sp.]|nr:hypothetical protein SPBRAN_184 [uncultured Candidatus Thioglobus sp.]